MENLVLKSLREKEIKLENQLEAIRDLIQDELRKPDVSSSIKEVDRPTDQSPKSYGDTVNQKFMSVLAEKQRFLKIREIAQVLSNTEGGLEDEWVTRLSRRTKKLKELGLITKFQVGKARTNVFWGGVKWLDSNGEIKAGYEYDPKAVSEKGSDALSDFEL